jgi:hypothetical protein
MYLEANAKHNSPWVAAYWTASYPDLMATYHRNLDKDCSGIDALENAPVNTDFVEGNMGVVDHLRHMSQVSFCYPPPPSPLPFYFYTFHRLSSSSFVHLPSFISLHLYRPT